MQANGLSVMLTGCFLLALAVSASPQHPRNSTTQAAVDPVFSKFTSPREPGCAVLVVRDGKVEVQKGYGVKDVRTFEPITAQTNFRLASLTKQFTATAVMYGPPRLDLYAVSPCLAGS